MKRLFFITFGFLLFCFTTHGQSTNLVEIFNGRGDFSNPQKILDLSYQNLEKVPVSALNPEIETLILDNNNLKELPSWIGQLNKLKILSLRNNNFQQLDFRINDCENLEQLYLSGNKYLSDISAISSTSKIRIIDVIDTQINELPAWVKMMDNLFYFKYTKNE